MRYFTEEVVAYGASINVMLERIPPRYTCCCQPANVMWIRPMKSSLREKWLVKIRRHLRDSKVANTSLKLRAPSRSTMVLWITDVWEHLPEKVILNGFRKCKLLDSTIEEYETSRGSLEDNVLDALMTNMAIEDTIDPDDDIDLSGNKSN
ncbi:unnamed protein product [Aphanomyces euteiches]